MMSLTKQPWLVSQLCGREARRRDYRQPAAANSQEGMSLPATDILSSLRPWPWASYCGTKKSACLSDGRMGVPDQVVSLARTTQAIPALVESPEVLVLEPGSPGSLILTVPLKYWPSHGVQCPSHLAISTQEIPARTRQGVLVLAQKDLWGAYLSGCSVAGTDTKCLPPPWDKRHAAQYWICSGLSDVLRVSKQKASTTGTGTYTVHGRLRYPHADQTPANRCFWPGLRRWHLAWTMPL